MMQPPKWTHIPPAEHFIQLEPTLYLHFAVTHFICLCTCVCALVFFFFSEEEVLLNKQKQSVAKWKRGTERLVMIVITKTLQQKVLVLLASVMIVFPS